MPADTLFLLTDQERYDVVAPDGPPVETPNIDALAADGMFFERAYTPISICSSARASLLTGLYPHNHGMLNNCHEPDAIREVLPADLPTFGERLAASGYHNTYLGKWHVGNERGPADFGFEYLGGADGPAAAGQGFLEYQRDLGVDPDDVELTDTLYTDTPDRTLVAATTSLPIEATYSYYLAERTIERLEAWDGEDGPHFHRTDFPGPHHPYTVPEPYASLYDPDEVDLPASFLEDYGKKPAVQEAYLSYRGVSEFTESDWRRVIAKYYGFVTLIDDQIGRILDAVDRIDREPVIVHTADHGDFTGSHRQFNKGPMMYEDTYHVPLVVRWPGSVAPGSTCDAFVRLLDLMPTVLSMAECDLPPDIDGRNLVPLLEGERPDDWPTSVFAEYHGDEFGLYSQRMVRTDRYKYVYNPPDVDELYDLKRDPDELQNLVDHPQYGDVLDRLRRRLHEWMLESDDSLRQWSANALME